MTPEEIAELARDIIDHKSNDADPQEHADKLVDAQIEDDDDDAVTMMPDDDSDDDEDLLDYLFNK